ncbi:hypothetical protein ACO0LF_29335 [Undibacterium sp. Di27W]|uniref:hypothetical protein n=1 Tax=Undibacterium sp. Di27W TaxID=3413036 RepID=UPI003BEF705D
MNTAFLHVVKDRKLAHILRQIADDFEILDFFQQYGSSCFAMSAMLAQLLSEKGYTARVQGCYAEIRQNNGIFYIGYKGLVHDNQREGHAVCIVDEQYLIDFGLGTLRKFYAEDFAHALACEISGTSPVLGTLNMNDGGDIAWRTDWISPMVEQELQAQAATVERILNVYDDFQRNRMSYLVKKLFVSKNDLPSDQAMLAIYQSMRSAAEEAQAELELTE